MWKINTLSKKYNGQHAIQDINLALHPKEITGLLGTNGAGKSTLIKSMLGFVIPDQGDIERAHPDEPVGYLPEAHYLPEHASALQVVTHTLRLRNHDASEAEALLLEIDLKKEAWSKPIRSYSKGMRQRTALACALAASPSWLVLDEPTSGLDALGRKHLLSLLERRRNEGAGIFICSHIVPDLVRLCNRILLIADGSIREEVSIQKHDFSEIDLLEQKLSQYHKSESVT
ncbi:ABC transporter ATP-binding protein [Pseudomonadota bacterium]